MKNGAISLGLAIIFMFSTFQVQALEKPTIGDNPTKEQVEQYNQQVDEYNAEATEYNNNVDKTYEEAKAAADKTNAEVAAHNQSELDRVAQEEATNQQIEQQNKENQEQAEANREENIRRQEEADAINIERQTAAEQEAAETNSQLKAEYDAAVEEENARVEQINAERQEQYNKDLAQYEIDLKYEKAILNLGYESVEQYNNAVNAYYNEPAARAIEENTNAEAITIEDLYEVVDAEEKAGETITVHLMHTLLDVELILSENIEIDINDTIILKPMGAVTKTTEPNYAEFYYNTDESHLQGYWWETYSDVESTTIINEYSWNCGDVHTLSYIDGTTDNAPAKDIYAWFEYTWKALRTAKLYNTPVEPELVLETPNPIEEPTYVEAEWEPYIPELLDETYEPKSLIKIIPADLWEIVEEPIKGNYISLLSYLTYIEREKPKTPTKTQTNSAPTAVETEPTIEPPVQNPEPPKTITDSAPPKAEPQDLGSWALINLITVLFNILFTLILILSRKKKEDENEEEEEEEKEDKEEEKKNHKGIIKIINILLTIFSIIFFILTENIFLPMVLIDKWTIFMIIIALIVDVLFLVYKYNKKEEEDEEETNN